MNTLLFQALCSYKDNHICPKMDFCWELVLYRLSGQEIGHVFQTCRDRRKLREREGLWNYLLRRDFPNHVKLVDHIAVVEVKRSVYTDLYQFGGYYFFRQIETWIYPVKPVCMYLDAAGDQIGITYRRPGEHRILRRPFEHHLIKFRSNHVTKSDRKKLLEGKCDERAFVRSDFLITVSTKEINRFEYLEEAIRAPYRSGKEPLIAWILQYFKVSEISLLTTPNRVKVIGELKDGIWLSYQKTVPLKFQTCGHGGGKTRDGPCPYPVSQNIKNLFPVSSGYGRCSLHPRCRPEDFEGLYKTSTKNFNGKGIFWFYERATIWLVHGHVSLSDSRIKKFTHLNEKPIGELLENVM
jgi:hypothetical protein